MSFDEYIEKQMPGYKEKLSDEKIQRLKNLYELKVGFASIAGVEDNLSSNFAKKGMLINAFNNMKKCSDKLNQEIELIKKQLNFNNIQNKEKKYVMIKDPI